MHVPWTKLVALNWLPVPAVVPLRRMTSRRHGCRAFESTAALLDDRRIDAVCICTPSGAHLEPAVAAAAAGKHVMIEKPLEITPDRCDQIIDACDRHNVWLGTIFQSRFQVAAQALKQAVEQGRFGHLSLGSAGVKWFRGQEYYDSAAWRGTWHLDGGGALMNQAIHSVDLLQWVMGPVAEVRAFVATRAHQRIEVEDTAVVLLRFASGALGTIEATTASWPGWRKRLEICGSGGSAILEDETIRRWEFSVGLPDDARWTNPDPVAGNLTGGATDPAAIGHAGHTAQLQDFVNSIRQGHRPQVDGREARKSVQIISAAYQSARQQRPVVLNP